MDFFCADHGLPECNEQCGFCRGFEQRHIAPQPPQRTYTEEELVDAVEDGMEFGHNSGLLELANLKSKLAEANTLIDQMGDALQDLMDATPKQTLDKDWWNDNLIHAFEKSKTMIDKALEFLKY